MLNVVIGILLVCSLLSPTSAKMKFSSGGAGVGGHIPPGILSFILN